MYDDLHQFSYHIKLIYYEYINIQIHFHFSSCGRIRNHGRLRISFRINEKGKEEEMERSSFSLSTLQGKPKCFSQFFTIIGKK